MLPTFFVVFACALLCVAIYSVWQALRAALGVGYVDPAYGAAASDESATLSDEKHAVLRALKDLEYEHAVDKISEEDFKRLDLQYRKRAREVLRALDAEVGTHRAEAERLVAAHVEAATRSKKKAISGAKKRAADKAAPAPAKAAAAPSPVPAKAAAAELPECPSCGTINDADATFCKKCATRIEPSAKVEPETEPADAAATAEAETESEEGARGEDEPAPSESVDAKDEPAAAVDEAATGAGEDEEGDDEEPDDAKAEPKESK